LGLVFASAELVWESHFETRGDNEMHKSLIAGIVGLGYLTGCSAGYDIGMKLEKSPDDFEILMGSFDGSMSIMHGNPKNATITATNGDITCDGASDTGKYSTDMGKNKVKHMFRITCDDGRTGNLMASITGRPSGLAGLNIFGSGIGKLSDGTKIKIVFGDASGTLGW
jgi:hypothetical protein